MTSDATSEIEGAEAAGKTRVLVVTNGPADPPGWTSHHPPRVTTTVASDPSEAAALAARHRFDAIVIDQAIAERGFDALPWLQGHCPGAAVLVQCTTGDPHSAREIVARAGGGTLLPAEVPVDLQAEIVRFAADCAHLTHELHTRTAALERRTRELERSRARFADIIEHNADAIVVVDADGAIQFANGSAAALFRTAREDLLGTPFGFPVVGGETTELDLPRPDSPAVVEMRVVESEWDGRPAYIASLRDITERTRAEKDARRLIQERAARATAENAAGRLRFIAEATTLLTLPLDYRETLSTLARLCVQNLADWVVIYLVENGNRVRRLEVAHRDPSMADLVRALRDDPIDPLGPHPVLQLLRDRTPRIVPDIDEDKLAGIAQTPHHQDLIERLGISSYMLVPMVARDRAIGAIALVSGSPDRRFGQEELAEATDLATRAALAVENARLLAEANEANRAKSELLAVISHDLRTPLNSIMGHTELLTLGIPEQLSAGSLDRVDRIRMSASHLVYLIDELLTFARIDGGREELVIEEVDASTIAAEVAAVVEPLAHARGLDFVAQLPSAPLRMRTDPNRLRQVLLNLIGNAIKYTDRGTVQFRIRRADGGLIDFEVRDTGIGIAPDHLEKIFEPFWQVDPSQRSTKGGTGLGLSVVRGLVRLLGGDVRVESQMGVGSAFCVELPLAPPRDDRDTPDVEFDDPAPHA